jgi:hypothetical protein
MWLQRYKKTGVGGQHNDDWMMSACVVGLALNQRTSNLIFLLPKWSENKIIHVRISFFLQFCCLVNNAFCCFNS